MEWWWNRSPHTAPHHTKKYKNRGTFAIFCFLIFYYGVGPCGVLIITSPSEIFWYKIVSFYSALVIYLEKCQSRNGLLFISENVKVNGVYFDPKKSSHTGHTVHTGHNTHTTSSIYWRYGTGLLFYFPWKYHNGGRLPESRKYVSRDTFQKWYTFGLGILGYHKKWPEQKVLQTAVQWITDNGFRYV